MRGRALANLFVDVRAGTDMESGSQRRRSQFSTRISAKRRARERPPHTEAAWPFVNRTPDRDKDAAIILTGRAAEIGVVLARSELGRGKRKAHIVLAIVLTTPARAGADLNGFAPRPQESGSVGPPRPCHHFGSMSPGWRRS
jgi:hypothetical protein